MAQVKALVLASQSPFRRQLLATTGIAFTTTDARVDEAAISAAAPEQLASRRAEAKALAAAATAAPGTLVIGADQVLSLDGQSFDKVATAAAAAARLTVLAGRTHWLHSGVALAWRGEAATGAASPELAEPAPTLLAAAVVSAAMPMRALTPAEINAYAATGEWQGSVGCYQYEHKGIHLFSGVTADQSTIIGLPLQELLAMLRSLGIDGLRQPAPPWQVQLSAPSLAPPR